MRSYAELLEASGYGSRPKDFDDLIRILDSEIRLITPTDPEGREEGESDSVSPNTSRSANTTNSPTTIWFPPCEMADPQAEGNEAGPGRTAAGGSCGGVECPTGESQLPSLLQWLQIRWLTQKKNWTPPQRKMMSEGGPVSCGAGDGGLASLLAVATFTGLAIRDQVDGTAEGNPCRWVGASRPECGHGSSASHCRRDGRVSPVDRSAAA